MTQEQVNSDLPAINMVDMLALARVNAAVKFLCEHGAWEQEQTHESLIPYIIEEAYELKDAINSADPAEIIAELGDVLLQVLLHAQLAHQQGDFSLAEVAAGLEQKLRIRSAPIFAGQTMTVAEQDEFWQAQKVKKSASVTADTFLKYARLSGSAWHQTVKLQRYLQKHEFPLELFPHDLRFLDAALYDEDENYRSLEELMQQIQRAVADYKKIPVTQAEWYKILCPQ